MAYGIDTTRCLLTVTHGKPDDYFKKLPCIECFNHAPVGS